MQKVAGSIPVTRSISFNHDLHDERPGVAPL